MKTHTHIIHALFVSAGLFDITGFAQSGTHALDRADVLPLTSQRDPAQVYFDEPGDGSIAARGKSYTAAFDSRGASFIPLFGADAPRDYPVRFRLESASSGDAPVPLALDVPPARAQRRITFERGVITELFELSPEGVEQEFVIAHALGQGDMRLRIGVETELEERARSDEQGEQGGVEFANERGSVRYSRAEAFDADGHRVAVTTAWVDGAIDLRIDARDLADVRFPLTIDPLIFSFAITNGTTESFWPDVAYDFSTDRFIVVYQEKLSAVSYQLWASEFTSGGGFVAGSTQMIASGVTEFSPAHVANNNSANQFLIVWESKPLLGLQTIYGRTYAAATFALGTTFTISPLDGVGRFNPDVGGDTQDVGTTYFCVVWEKLTSSAVHTIEAQLVNPNGTLAGAAFPIDGSSAINSVPRVSKSDGQAPLASMAWTIVWQRQFNPTDHDIWAAQVNKTGAVTLPPFPIDGGGADDTNPAVSSVVGGQGTAPREYLVTFERNIAGRHDIIGALRQGIAVINEQDLTSLEQGTSAADNTLPSVETDGASFVVLCAQYWFGVHDVYFARFAPVGAHLEIQTEYEVGPIDQADTMHANLASTYDGNLGSYRMFGVGDNQPNASSNHAVWGLVHDTSPFAVMCTPGDGVTAPCPCNNPGLGIGWGCNNSANTGGGTLIVTGTAMPGVNDTVVLSAGHMLPNATCIFWQGDGVSELGIVFGSGQRCFSGHLIRLGTHTASGGSAVYPGAGDLSVSGRCAAAGSPIVDGTTRWYQTSYRDANSPCGLPATFNATAGVQVFWR
jgi:hypothetical protein